MTFLLGIDQGTSGTRTVVYDETLVPLADAYVACAPATPHAGHVEHDPAALLAAVERTAREALAKVGATRADAVGLANQGETTVAWDARSGVALAPALVWQDRRTEPVLQALRASGAAELVERRSGLPLDPYFSSSKMRWLLHEPTVTAARAAGRLRLATSDAYLRERLTGRYATDPATASRTQLLDMITVRWDPELCAAFGVPASVLPPVEATCGALGDTAFGPLTAAVTDQQAALAGHGCFAEGEAKCTYGTGCFLLTNAGTAMPPGGSGLLPTIAWQLGGKTTYATDGGVLSASSALAWLATLGVLGAAQDADAIAATVPDCDGVRFLPALGGLGAPWWRSGSRAVFAGMTAATRPGQLVRAVLEAIAFRVRDIVEADPGAPLAALRVDGGLSSSRVLMQLQADILGIPLERSQAPESTALGAAALAGIGAGVLPDGDAVRALLRAPEIIEPRWSADRRDGAYDEWRTFLERASELR